MIAMLFPFGGATETAASIVFGFIFLFSLGKSFYHVKKKEIAIHREWMIRSFAIGLGAASYPAVHWDS